MRFLPHLFAALLATTTLTTQVASACGGYVDINPAPRVLTVSAHTINPGTRRPGRRVFVELGHTIKDDGKAAWSFVAPRTYDTTQFMTLPRLAAPLEITLVGPSGVRVVKTDKQVALRNGWNGKDPRVAVEVSLKDGERILYALVDVRELAATKV